MGRKALEVLQDIADQLGWVQPTTVENADLLDKDDRKLIRAFNRTLRVLSGIEDWHSLRTDGEITLTAEYTTGVARVTNGSTAVSGISSPTTGLSPTWTNAMVGRAFIVAGHPVVYRVASVTGQFALVLDRAYVGTSTNGTTTAPDAEYHIVQDRYDLPTDFDRPVDEDWTRYDTSSKATVRVVSPKEVASRRKARPSDSVGDPDVVTLWKQDEQGEHRVAVFDRYPNTARVIRFEYQRQHPLIEDDTQRILFDMKTEEMIQAGVEYLILRGPDDDAKAGMMLGEFLRERMDAVAKGEIGKQRTRLTISQARAIRERTKWSRKGRRTDWGSFFDRANFHDL